MAKEIILVDGYNIIFAWERLKDLAADNLNQARDALLDIMSNYQGFRKCEVIVVFDAHKVKGSIRKVCPYNNIDVVYTKEAETADHYIERLVHVIGKDFRVRVATSDALEQSIILGKGATRISAKEFEREINDTEMNIREVIIEEKPIKDNMLMSHLDPGVRAFMEKLRREK